MDFYVKLASISLLVIALDRIYSSVNHFFIERKAQRTNKEMLGFLKNQDKMRSDHDHLYGEYIKAANRIKELESQLKDLPQLTIQ